MASVLCFHFFAHEACGILASWSRMKPTPPCIGCKISTTEPPWKPYYFVISMLLFILLPVKTFIRRWKTRGPQYLCCSKTRNAWYCIPFCLSRPALKNLYIYIYIYIYIHTHTHTHTHIQMGIHTDTDYLHF